jgi:hypothetical protein
VHPNEIRGFDAESEEAFQIEHRATMKAYRERMKAYAEQIEAQAPSQKGKAKNKRLNRKVNNDV